MTLDSGTRIGRIRIDDLLGTGGMGEVYRGWDEKLERAVALKVVHADKRLSTAMHNRFLREARVLSKLDHPNICRIYDVLEREDGDYLVLELVEGATLRTRMREALSHREALDVALQVARVLAVTHARGIVHRDLKPDNIMLTPDGQVKVLDFGLARALVAPEQEQDREPPMTAEDFTADDFEKTAVLGRRGSSTESADTHTAAGSLVGTLHYMSPEQARGLPLSEETDVYSLGIVLYEMFAGERAYDETTSLNELLVHVRRAEVRPFDFHDRGLNALLKRMLALYPSERPRAEEVVRALEAIRARPARIRRRTIAAAGIAAIVLTIAAAYLISRRMESTRRLFASSEHGRLAILPFRNATGDPSLRWIDAGLQSLVTEGVSRARGADVVAADDVARAIGNLRLNTARDLAPEQRRALLSALGADVAILPTVVSQDGKYTIRYAALRPDGAENPREVTSTAVVDAARQMSVQLAQRIDPAITPATVRASYSLDSMANTLFAMAIPEWRVHGARVASHYLTVCVDRDPDFVLAKIFLANSYQQLADHVRAKELLADALARAQQRNDRGLIMRGLLMRASWANDAGEYAVAERAGNEALALARALQDDDLGAVSLTQLGNAALRMGQLDRARVRFAEALRIATRLHDVHLQAELNNNLGIVADSAQRPPAEGQKYFEAALAIADRLNDRMTAATAIGNLASSYGNTGDFARAETMTRRQVALSRELGDRDTEVVSLVNLGLWLWAQGKEREAVQTTEQAVGLVERVGNRRIESVLHSNLATAYTKLGNLAAARTESETALRKAEGLNDPEVDRDVQLGTAYALIRDGRLADAARALDRAERWQRNDRTEMMRARLAYAHGDYRQAFERITKAKSLGGPWLTQNEQMRRAFEESARSGRPSSIAFESPVTAG
jgi:tetratricopeptide (TPR) repeat protein